MDRTEAARDLRGSKAGADKRMDGWTDRRMDGTEDPAAVCASDFAFTPTRRKLCR
jgi:hypothetical protein